MIKGKDTHFDADILEAFLALQKEFRLIAQHFVDVNKYEDKQKESLSSGADDLAK
jgi:hypothetical protein